MELTERYRRWKAEGGDNDSMEDKTEYDGEGGSPEIFIYLTQLAGKPDQWLLGYSDLTLQFIKWCTTSSAQGLVRSSQPLPLASLNSGTMEDSGPNVTWDFDAGTMRHQQKTPSQEENGEEEGGEDQRRLTLVEMEGIEFSPQLSVDETLLAVNHRVSIAEGEEGEEEQNNSMKRSSVIRVEDEEGEENTVVSLRDALEISHDSCRSLSLSLFRETLCFLN